MIGTLVAAFLGVAGLAPALNSPLVGGSEGRGPVTDTTNVGTLVLGGALGTLPATFWGANYNFATGPGGFANGTVAEYLNETPVTWLRLPLLDTSYTNPTPWKAVAQFCAWTNCQEIATVGGPGTTAAQAVQDMERAESYGIHPEYWAFGNEPDLWNVSGTMETPAAYALVVHQWIALAQASFPDAKFIGIEISGRPSVGDAFISQVAAVDGPNISALAIQLYPQFGGTTVAKFMKSLTLGTSVGPAVANAESLIAQACPSCHIPIFLNEFQGGSGYNTNYIPFRETLPDATFFAASMVQGLRLGLQQFTPWTLTGSFSGNVSPPGNCDMGLIELTLTCDGSLFNPTYYLYSNLLDQLPFGTLTNVSQAGDANVYAVAVTDGANTSVFVVNADPVNADNFTLGSGFPVSGTIVSYAMDENHVATPLIREVSLQSDPDPSFTLSPLGIMVLSFAPPAQVALSAQPESVTIGQPLDVSTLVVGGQASSYAYEGLPPGCPPVDAAQISCIPTTTGFFPIHVTVVLTTGDSYTAKASVSVVAASGPVGPPPTGPSNYSVEFVPVGIPNGTVWTVNVSGYGALSGAGILRPYLSNGTHLYDADVPTNSTANATGTFTVAGAPLVINVTFGGDPPDPPPPGGLAEWFGATFGELEIVLEAAVGSTVIFCVGFWYSRH
ncbi:MAG: hypothetical protein WCB19_06935 [Thermoplasmata archaeon]